jgi:hypothetical protein
VKMCYCENSILVWENHMIHNAVMWLQTLLFWFFTL